MKQKKDKKNAPQVSRRHFAKTIAASIAATPLVASMAQAQTPPATKQAPAPPNPQPSPTPQPVSLAAAAYGDVAAARFGDKLTPEQLARVKRDLEGNVRTSERLGAVKLQNSEEPDFVFIA